MNIRLCESPQGDVVTIVVSDDNHISTKELCDEVTDYLKMLKEAVTIYDNSKISTED